MRFLQALLSGVPVRLIAERLVKPSSEAVEAITRWVAGILADRKRERQTAPSVHRKEFQVEGRSYVVLLSIDSSYRTVHGSFRYLSGIISLNVPPRVSDQQIRGSVEHELVHHVQYSRRTADHDYGLPKKRIRDPEIKQGGSLDVLTIADRLSRHALDDREFFPNLTTAASEFRNVIKVRRIRSPDAVDRLFRSMTGQEDFGGRLALSRGRFFFLDLKEKNPEKWKRAVSLLYQELFGE